MRERSSVRDFVIVCLNVSGASSSCRVTDRRFPHRFSVLAEFRIRRWAAEVSCSVTSQPAWAACWVGTLDRSASSASAVLTDFVPGQLLTGLVLMSSRRSGVRVLRLVSFELIRGRAGLQAFVGRGSLRIRRRLGGRTAGSRSLARSSLM